MPISLRKTRTTSFSSAEERRQLRLRRLLSILRIAAVIGLSVLFIFMLLERRLVFPAPKAVESQVDASEFGGEDVFFESADGTRLHGQYFLHEQPRGQLIYFHGNGIMVSQLSEYADWMRSKYGYSVWVFDYRGYGLSDGSPTGEAVLQDAEAAYAWLVERTGCASEDVILMGRSLGGGLAVHVASLQGARGLILQNTFSSLVATASRQFPWLPVRTVMKTRINSIDKIGKYDGPLLQSHGTSDRVIPYELGRELFETANEPKQFFTIEGGSHNGHNPPEYVEVLLQFLDELER